MIGTLFSSEILIRLRAKIIEYSNMASKIQICVPVIQSSILLNPLFGGASVDPYTLVLMRYNVINKPILPGTCVGWSEFFKILIFEFTHQILELHMCISKTWCVRYVGIRNLAAETKHLSDAKENNKSKCIPMYVLFNITSYTFGETKNIFTSFIAKFLLPIRTHSQYQQNFNYFFNTQVGNGTSGEKNVIQNCKKQKITQPFWRAGGRLCVLIAISKMAALILFLQFWIRSILITNFEVRIRLTFSPLSYPCKLR